MSLKPAKTRRYVPALGFHWLTPAYDLAVRLTTRERSFKSALIKQAAIGPGHQVLDLACGTGTLAIWIKQRVPEAGVIGLDADPRVLEVAERKARKAGVDVQFCEGYSTALPWEGGRFDRVLSSLFFHHLNWDDKRRTAVEVRRVLKAGGQLHVADWGQARNPLMRAAFLTVQVLDGFENTRDNVAGRLPELFTGAGLAGAAERRRFSTVLGTLSLYSAAAPGG